MNAVLKERLPTAADAFRAAGVKDVTPFEGLALPFPLWKHQIRELNMSLRMPRFGLYPRPRLGKTMVMYLNAIYCAQYGVRTIMLVPPVVFPQMLMEWGRIQGNPFSMAVFKKGPEARDKLLKKWRLDNSSAPHVLLMTSSIFVKEREWLHHVGYTNLAFDECHQGLAKATTQTYQAVSWFAEQKGSRLILSTGTPIPTSPTKAYPIIKLNNPKAFYDEAEFERRHVQFKTVMVTNKRGQKISLNVPDKSFDIPTIHKALYKYGDRETGEGVVLLNKPKVQVVPLQLTPQHYALYQRVGKARLVEFEDGSVINAIQATKFRQVMMQLITSPNEYGGKIKTNSIVEMVMELIREYPDSEKVVVFAHFNSSCETLQAALQKPFGSVLLYGKNTGRQNQAAVAKFIDKTNRVNRVLVCSTLSGGVSLTLGGVSSTVIFAEVPETYGQLDQAMSRVALVNKTEEVNAYLLRAMATLQEKRIPMLLSRTKDIQQANMDLSTLLDELMIKV